MGSSAHGMRCNVEATLSLAAPLLEFAPEPPHGGPWGRERWGYDSQTQFLANRGYAVLLPNFRGSTGYGKKFLDAGNGQWGDRMQDDLTWGVKYLIASAKQEHWCRRYGKQCSRHEV